MTAAFLPPALGRAMEMDSQERRFRVVTEFRKQRARLAFAAVKPRWRRGDLAGVLDAQVGRRSAPFRTALDAAAIRDWTGAHRGLAAHFFERAPLFLVAPGAIAGVADLVRERFEDATQAAIDRAERMAGGGFDILGYRNLPFGSPPRWTYDPVHDRTAHEGFWSDVKYLDPAGGDHKVIWEINRHQHWLAYARAFHLAGDRRFYRAFVTELTDWLRTNPPLHGINWASMLELAFRSLSWVWALHVFAGAALDSNTGDPETPWVVDLLIALDRQLTHVEHNLSRYFSPNTHLTGEALALYVAGCALPELRGAVRRAQLGRDILLCEAQRQVRDDGGHAELSAHYHRYSTDFYLVAATVARASQDPCSDVLLEAAHRQARYLRTIADADGRLPLTGDDDGGQTFPICGRRPSDCRDTLATAAAVTGDDALRIGTVPEETYWFCDGGRTAPALSEMREPRTGEWPSTALAGTGYCVSRRDRSYLLFDAGPHGFLNGGHAHADALSVVLTVHGRPLLIDPGTATYTMDPDQRDRFRSSAMHNTVVVGGRSQSEPNGPFHWRSRTDARLTAWRSNPVFDYAEARHAGYAPVEHVRGVLAVHELGWFIVDHLLGDRDVRADINWHVHPAWRIQESGGCTATLVHEDATQEAIACSIPLTQLNSAEAAGLDMWSPEYGRVDHAPVLRAHLSRTLPASVLTYIPARSAGTPRVFAEDSQEDTMAGSHATRFGVRWPGVEAQLVSVVTADGSPGRTELTINGSVCVVLG